VIGEVGLVHTIQDFAIGVYKENCKILLPVALCDPILVPGLRMSLVEGGSKVVVSVILRLAAGVCPLSYRDLKALLSTLVGFQGENLHRQQSSFYTLDTKLEYFNDYYVAQLVEWRVKWASKLCTSGHALPAGHSACMMRLRSFTTQWTASI
jgi:hypothetical protein